ncbi:MAG: hypothetical protein KatS3mg105_3314 [Gemmatales bacterium]|nr:MAG: hypothetical protein KatS3mg105_3314 [Gemmatales bacterium]
MKTRSEIEKLQRAALAEALWMMRKGIFSQGVKDRVRAAIPDQKTADYYFERMKTWWEERHNN